MLYKVQERHNNLDFNSDDGRGRQMSEKNHPSSRHQWQNQTLNPCPECPQWATCPQATCWGGQPTFKRYNQPSAWGFYCLKRQKTISLLSLENTVQGTAKRSLFRPSVWTFSILSRRHFIFKKWKRTDLIHANSSVEIKPLHLKSRVLSKKRWENWVGIGKEGEKQQKRFLQHNILEFRFVCGSS